MNNAFKIKQIYLKDVSFQAPMGAAAFSQEWSPKVQVDLKVSSESLGSDLYEVSLTISVISRTGANTHFVAEIVQCGVFGLSGHNEFEANQILCTDCPEALYPYAREAIDSLTAKARFPNLLLDPIDFAASYAAK